MLRIKFIVNIEVGKKPFHQLTTTSWGRLRTLVRNRDDAICRYCGEIDESGDVDHIIPLSRGGTDSIDNLTWSCQSCNRSKGDKTPDEWQSQMATGFDRDAPIPLILDSSRLPETIIDLGGLKTLIKDDSGNWVEISDEEYQELRTQYAIPITELNTPLVYPITDLPDTPPISHRQITDDEVIDL